MDYEIEGEPMPVVIRGLNAAEAMIAEKGSMVWMRPNVEMRTSAGGVGKAFGRMSSGGSMFQDLYTAKGSPGKAVPQAMPLGALAGSISSVLPGKGWTRAVWSGEAPAEIPPGPRALLFSLPLRTASPRPGPRRRRTRRCTSPWDSSRGSPPGRRPWRRRGRRRRRR